MNRPLRGTLLALATLALAHCQSPSTVPADMPPVSGASHALLWSNDLLAQNAGGGMIRPGASLGMYITGFLMDATGIHLQSATSGIEQGLGILQADQESLSGSFLILQQLGSVLQVDVPDMLNRSDDRQKAIDSYVDTLTQIFNRSKAQLTALKQQQAELTQTLHTERGAVTTIQHDLNTALQKKDYTTASAKQSEIVDAKAAEAKTQTQVTQLQSIIDLYNDLNKIADRRLKAIAANRAALIAGVQVVDLPGVNDLGVLRKQNGGDSTNTTTIFGPTGR